MSRAPIRSILILCLMMFQDEVVCGHTSGRKNRPLTKKEVIAECYSFLCIGLLMLLADASHSSHSMGTSTSFQKRLLSISEWCICFCSAIVLFQRRTIIHLCQENPDSKAGSVILSSKHFISLGNMQNRAYFVGVGSQHGDFPPEHQWLFRAHLLEEYLCLSSKYTSLGSKDGPLAVRIGRNRLSPS